MLRPENPKSLIIDPQRTTEVCKEEFFKEIHQLHLTKRTVVHLVVMEYPATMHCSYANSEENPMTGKSEARCLRFAVDLLARFYYIASIFYYIALIHVQVSLGMWKKIKATQPGLPTNSVA